ncbi:PTS system mannose/fructose/sorbose family transporter subunit IID [Propionispora vibrioides]|uniref:PTS system, D-glucosaminate-specific IID component n=1 Tax=Propionispora vibrioides TaxID=112903 RepID=A0A1H8XIH8_9FIRM|nr:PTS system mannose/fructose/sorbose family transporter subunit IID [Propionispora vibrioides]SEP39705.1 PTS system, D-glucosaminate-specific IID component [Propionispora vibrioides]
MMENTKNSTVGLSKLDLEFAILRWWFFSHMAYNYQRLQAGGFAVMMGPLLKKLYPDKPGEVIAGLKRHMMFFNTEPRWGAVIHGIVIALEEQRAKGMEIDDATIVDLKSSLMGPLAGIGDTISGGLYKPCLLGICLGWAATGSIMGPLMFGVFMLGYDLLITHLAIRKGYSLGTSAVTSVLEGGLFKRLTTFFTIMGLFVLGVMVCKFITIDFAWIPVLAGKKIVVKELIDKIVPKILPLLITLVCWQAIMRGVKVVYVLLALFAFALAGGALGLIG